ncbi:alanine--tRNA ligase-related protein, partial [Frisingicoccus sp.]
IDEEGFQAAMTEQKEKARSARKTTNYMGADVTVYQSIDAAITSEFVGYDKLTCESPITVLTTESEVVEALVDGQNGTIFTEQTPFYATSGGQEGDQGIITLGNSVFEVKDTIKLQGGKIGHVGVVTSGMFKKGDKVTLSVNESRRTAACKNHSATHLLQKALKIVLGNHVEQAGSSNNDKHLRFDFTHFSAMSAEELKKVEDIVNAEIAAALPVQTDVMSIEDAKKTGAMALFGEKYGENVRVVSMGDFSKELCGGTHVANTANIALFKIVSEAGVAAGVRRIEALTGQGVIEYYNKLEQSLNEAAAAAKCEPAQLVKRIGTLQEEIKELHRENDKLKNQMAKDAMGDVMDQVTEVSGVKLLAVKLDNVDMNELRNLGDQLKEKLGDGVIVLASASEGKVSLITMATEGAIAKGAHAGNIIKAIAKHVGGGGGGRPNMAQAGGKNPNGIDAALAEAKNVLGSQIN